MNSATHSLPTTSSSNEPKKKFGTNLNKLAKPPPPSSSTSTQRSAQSSSTSSRTGLLVLSTKRSSSSSLVGKNKVASTAPKPLNTPSLKSEAVYDAREANSSTTQTAAWGVVDKLTSPGQNNSGGGTTQNSLPVLAPKGKKYEQTKNIAENSKNSGEGLNKRNDPISKTETKGEIPNNTFLKKNDIESNIEGKKETHHEERKNRLNERPERRKEDIRRYIDNIPSVVIPQGIIVTTETPPPPTIMPRHAPNGKDAEVVLELLAPKHAVAAKVDELEQKAPIDKEKALVKPTKTFSSLVGGTDQHDTPPVPFIQLSGYDDRDRGQQAGPKMLFDPKSGSMVAVPSDKRVSFPKEKRKPKPKPRSQVNAPPLVAIVKRVDKKKNDKELFKPPRTCGVLYKLDEEGNYISADGCNPDQGHGSHSVPGGRTRYPHAYAKYLEQQRLLVKQQASYNAKDKLNRESFYEYSEANLKLNHNAQPFTLKQPLNYTPSRMKTEISILSGDPESPELNPNSNPWAPNTAALAYSNHLAAAKLPPFDMIPLDSASNTDHECEASQSFEGLGFDPTENMDNFIMSPSLKSSADDENLDFQSLTIDLNTSGEDLKPFALTKTILDASTWSTPALTRNTATINTAIGAAVPPSSTLNWNLLGTESSKSPPPHLHPANSSNAANNTPAKSFLSLSPLSVHREGVVNWGTPGGLGGIDITGLSMRHNKSKDTSE